MNQIKKRFFLGLSANAFGQIVTIVTQFAAVPFFIKAWGVNLYGEWLVLNAIPAYLALSDVGFSSAASNEMTINVARNDIKDALEVFQSVWLLLLVLSILIFMFFYGVTSIFNISNVLGVHEIPESELKKIAFALIFYTYAGQQSGLLAGCLKSSGHYALGAFYLNSIRLSEFVGTVIALKLKEDPVILSYTLTAIRTIGVLGMLTLVSIKVKWIQYGFKFAQLKTIKRLMAPAFAFMGIPLGNAINIQGLVILIGTLLGPTKVVIFSTLRTLSRVAFQAITIINQSIWPEISAAYGQKKYDLMRSLFVKSSKISFFVAIVIGIILTVMGRAILKIWTHGRIEMDNSLFILLIIITIANAIWFSGFTTLSAINRHKIVASLFALSNLTAIIVAYYLAPFLGLKGCAISLFLVDIVMTIGVVFSLSKLFKKNPFKLSGLIANRYIK